MAFESVLLNFLKLKVFIYCYFLFYVYIPIMITEYCKHSVRRNCSIFKL